MRKDYNHEIARLAKPLAGLLMMAGMTDCTVLVSAGKVGVMRGLYAADIVPGEDAPRDPFSDLDAESETVADKVGGAGEAAQEAEVPRRTWKVNPVRMQDNVTIVAAVRPTSRGGWYQRTNIERMVLRRTTADVTAVRSVINDLVEQYRIEAVKFGSKVYYRRADRDALLAATVRKLKEGVA